MKVAEIFYSIQGEGVSSGVPAVFIRLAGCNLMCGGSGGGLVANGKATWHCDSEKLWQNGKLYTNEELENFLTDLNVLPFILKGNTHLVWTGGEPTMSANAADIQSFIEYMNIKYCDNRIFHEIETNGTLPSSLYTLMSQINCSPKLSNTGMPKHKRINIEAIYNIMAQTGYWTDNNARYWFKFVVSNEQDVIEAWNDFVIPFNIPLSQVILMPGVDDVKDLSARTALICELAKKYHCRMCTRIQTLCWNKKTGV